MIGQLVTLKHARFCELPKNLVPENENECEDRSAGQCLFLVKAAGTDLHGWDALISIS